MVFPPPGIDAPGYVLRIVPERLGGVGPWAGEGRLTPRAWEWDVDGRSLGWAMMETDASFSRDEFAGALQRGGGDAPATELRERLPAAGGGPVSAT